MYLKALSNGSIVLDPGVEFLSIAKLPTVVRALRSKNELSYEMCWSEAQNNIDHTYVQTVCFLQFCKSNFKYSFQEYPHNLLPKIV